MVVPYKEAQSSKKEQVREMFDNIAPRYDFLNHFLSVGIDKLWRKKVCKIVAKGNPKVIMDMASGTGDLAIGLSKLKPERIVGVDISENMLKIGEKKVEKKGLDNLISFRVGDAENLEDPNDTYDAITCAFGVRNFENIHKGLSEFHRVLKNEGRLVILELSMPENKFFKLIYKVYFSYILPLWGKVVSKNDVAYNYLPESVANFPKRSVFLENMKDAGFKDCYAKSLTFGIATIFVGTK
ncbi:demethylmenaquinone methyltransferase [Balneicella halophila]|uniref:Demethylmenaquinone methyltransferase n=1 Tax=Balneicella halophila TaxID=1537566 RepID=A0A7L4URG4_BALHA|nr:bifunctional demethylmenaquinone methyltransferase/2-methoxy-6-polyprenyl-1,4-benzoquinol methylase UbiE [Balneicella halophila]PVX52356.1 demethylmenaquinone methyltransferase [Balneicella halophila]